MISLVSIIVLVPAILFIISFVIAKYAFRKRKKSIGIAADITTFLLFFSVSHVFNVIFGKEIGFIIIIIFAIFIATIMTILEWRMKKEIEIKPLLRKVWRLFFILLCFMYALLWIIGVIRYVLKYIS
ncbi:DUF3397 family protein [Psychrobacillus sp. BL-248-WT-3]|uniref:DUF3397 family protein n=1 Tax=Psychrobacillus sp. BL-248-WT-3 TaxID=2725306 RepID=UPI00146D700A|nr:DUF3397 family protein [Psychrobacillus sp. BL-248-WT-3]NME05230.1 DUF3397 domain-containing protein [Psychrobacillus sp. BL-248-WT-3]